MLTGALLCACAASADLPASIVEKNGERHTVSTVYFNASLERVRGAMTECEHLPHWLVAAERALTACTGDVQTGGSYRHEFAGPGGRGFVQYGDYLEVSPTRIVHTEAYEGYDWAPLRVTTDYAPHGSGAVMRVSIEYPSAAVRDGDFAALEHALPGYDRLRTYLSGQ